MTLIQKALVAGLMVTAVAQAADTTIVKVGYIQVCNGTSTVLEPVSATYEINADGLAIPTISFEGTELTYTDLTRPHRGFPTLKWIHDDSELSSKIGTFFVITATIGRNSGLTEIKTGEGGTMPYKEILTTFKVAGEVIDGWTPVSVASVQYKRPDGTYYEKSYESPTPTEWRKVETRVIAPTETSRKVHMACSYNKPLHPDLLAALQKCKKWEEYGFTVNDKNAVRPSAKGFKLPIIVQFVTSSTVEQRLLTRDLHGQVTESEWLTVGSRHFLDTTKGIDLTFTPDREIERITCYEPAQQLHILDGGLINRI